MHFDHLAILDEVEICGVVDDLCWWRVEMLENVLLFKRES